MIFLKIFSIYHLMGAKKLKKCVYLVLLIDTTILGQKLPLIQIPWGTCPIWKDKEIEFLEIELLTG